MDNKLVSVMKKILLLVWMPAWVCLGPAAWPCQAAAEEGVALAILYDASGSMGDSVRDANGKLSPKHVIAKRALSAIVQRLQAYVAGAPGGEPRKLSAGLYVFQGTAARAVVPLGPFDSKRAANWTNNLPSPSSGTPIGASLETATQALLKSSLAQKHILVITDGENPAGPAPEAVLPRLKAQAAKQGAGLNVHFVAFDVDARLFDPLKKQGVKVVGAANETQLNTQLQTILVKEILLEDPDPPKKK
jgi:hypothetical protein